MKFFGDMPLIAGEIWQKSSFALQEKCPSLYTEKTKRFEACPYRNRHMYQTSISSPRKMPFTIDRVAMNRFENMPLINDAI